MFIMFLVGCGSFVFMMLVIFIGVLIATYLPPQDRSEIQ